MSTTPRVVIGLSAAALAVSLAACSSSAAKSDAATKASSSPPSSTTVSSTPAAPTTDSSAAATTDYAALLIDATDIPVPGVKKGAVAAPPQGTGATVAFTAAGGRTLGDTVLILPDASAAQSAAESSVAAAKQSITAAVASDAPIGGGGTAIRGTSSNGAVAVLIFSEGKALVVLEFDSPADDPVSTAIVQQVATAQDTKIKDGLSG